MSPSIFVKITYVLPIITTAFLIGALAVVQGIYAKYFALPLTTIATILVVARIFDAVTDPLIGYYSDQYYGRYGTRKPFVVLGGVLFVISSYLLYVPVNLDVISTLEDNSVSTPVSAWYFLFSFLGFYLAWTLFEIPHMAWGSDLSLSSQDSALIYSFRTTATWLGTAGFYAIPLLPISATKTITPETLSQAVIFSGSLMLLLLLVCVRFTPNGKNAHLKNSRSNKSAPVSRISVFGCEILKNKPLLLFLIAYIFSNVAVSGMWFTLIFIYVDAFLGLGKFFAQASLVSVMIGLMMVFVWYCLSNILGKKITMSISLVLSSIGIFLTGILSPSESGFFDLLWPMLLCYSLGATAIHALAPSLLSDIIDYSYWKFKVDRRATYFSLFMMVSKLSMAVGGGLGLAIAGSYGFDPSAQIYSDSGVIGLRLAIAWIPAFIVLLAIPFFLLNPITSRRHKVIIRRLETT